MTPCSARIRFAATRSSSKFMCPLLSDWSTMLVRLDPCRRDHARPARELAAHERAEALGAPAHRDHALLREQLADVGVLEHGVHLGVQLADHGLARPRWSEHAVPGIHFEVRET